MVKVEKLYKITCKETFVEFEQDEDEVTKGLITNTFPSSVD